MVTISGKSQPCSWCNHPNNLTPAAQLLPVFCAQCGHRADVPRAMCDCGECLELRGINEPGRAEVDILTHGAAAGG